MRCIFNYFFFKFSLARKITLHFFIFILFRMKIIKMHFDVVFGLYSGTRSRAVGSAPAFTGNYFSYDVCSLRLQQYSLALRRPMRYISTPWDITGRRRWKAKAKLSAQYRIGGVWTKCPRTKCPRTKYHWKKALLGQNATNEWVWRTWPTLWVG